MDNGYTFLKWNGQYGSTALFIVRDNSTSQQSLFCPERPNDITWVNTDLTAFDEYSSWEDFGNESVDSLDGIVF